MIKFSKNNFTKDELNVLWPLYIEIYTRSSFEQFLFDFSQIDYFKNER